MTPNDFVFWLIGYLEASEEQFELSKELKRIKLAVDHVVINDQGTE